MKVRTLEVHPSAVVRVRRTSAVVRVRRTKPEAEREGQLAKSL